MYDIDLLPNPCVNAFCEYLDGSFPCHCSKFGENIHKIERIYTCERYKDFEDYTNNTDTAGNPINQ